MTDATLLPFDLSAVRRKKLTVDFGGGNQPSDGGLLLLRHDPLMKLAVGRCPESGQPLASQSTISRLENAPSRTEAALLTAALVDQAGATISPCKQEILDIDDTFSAAHGGQQLAFWNAHHDERGFASMHSAPFPAASTGRRWTIGYGNKNQL